MKKIILLLLLCISSLANKKLALNKPVKLQMLEVLSANENLHASYFNYDAAKVVSAKKKVEELVAKIESKSLKKYLDKALGSLVKITEKAKQEDNNKYYHIASVYFIQIINKYDLGKKYQAYYCPMVRKKWIQNVDKDARVNNPYDSSMPHCGGRL